MKALLVQITVKATVVLIAAWLVTRVMTRGSAASRHLVWTLAIVAVLALPAVQLADPRLDVPLLPAEPAAPTGCRRGACGSAWGGAGVRPHTWIDSTP